MKPEIKIIRSAISSLPSVSIIQFLKERGVYVIGCDIISDSSARHFVDDFFLVSKTNATTKVQVIEQYISAIEKHKAKWIVSGPENEILLLAEYENKFKERNCLLFHPSKPVLDIITDKHELYKKLQGVVPLKQSCLLKEFNKAQSFLSNKVVIKPKNGRGSSGIFIINNNPGELAEVANKVNNEAYIIQEFIDGKEFTVDVLFDNEGALLNAVIRERLSVSSGIVVAAKTVKNECILEYILRLQKEFIFRGISCIQFREEGNEFYLTDINPRIGGGCILSLTASKSMADNFINLLHMNYEDLKYGSFDAEEKTMYRYYSEIYV